MKSIATIMLAAAACLAIPHQARATGDLGCEIADNNVRFDFNTLINRGTGLFLDGKTRFESARPEIVPVLRKLDHQKLQLVHSWYVGDEIRLQFYAEHQDDEIDFASVTLTVMTSTNENDDYVGAYRLAVEGPGAVVLEGKASCIVG